MIHSFWYNNILPFFSLFTSAATLICCALPALLVTLGFGATLVGITSAAPWLIALSEHKDILFTVAGLLLLIATILQWRSRHAPCPIEPKAAQMCKNLRRWGWGIIGLSIILYVIGFFFAYFAADLLL